MPLKRCELRNIASVAQFYDELARQLPLPAHFGRNLDALWDVLTGDLEGPLEIVWVNAAAARALLGEDYPKLAGLLEDAAAERGDLTVRLLPGEKQPG